MSSANESPGFVGCSCAALWAGLLATVALIVGGIILVVNHGDKIIALIQRMFS